MPSILLELNNRMDRDPFYERCCVTGRRPVQRHHNLNHARNSINEYFCILPVHKSVHDIEKRPDIKSRLDWIMLNRATVEQLHRYSQVIDWVARRKALNKVFGRFDPEQPRYIVI